MIQHLILRLGASCWGVLGVAVVAFLILHLAPGDPASIMLASGAPVDNVKQLRREMGLDRPLAVQFGRYVERLSRGDLGVSIYSGVPVLELIRERMPLTLVLAFGGFAWSLLLGIPIGIFAALHRGSVYDYGVIGATVLGLCTPGFWNGLLLIIVFAATLHWFPVSGAVSVSAGLLPYLQHLVLPWVSLAVPSIGIVARLVRSGLLDELGADYVRTARAKGAGNMAVVLRHALKNALIPIITVSGFQLANLIGGVVFTETVFALPGLGRMVTQAIAARDYPVIQGALIVIGVAIALINVLVDLSYEIVDPRLRHVA